MIEPLTAYSLDFPVSDASGSLLTAMSGTFTLKDGGGAVIKSGDVTVPAGVATFSISVSDVPDVVGDKYREFWDLSLSSSAGIESRILDRPVYVVRRTLYPVISLQDLYKEHPEINPSLAENIVPFVDATTPFDLTPFVVEAWTDIEQMLIDEGQRPSMILDSTALRRVHKYLSLAYIFDFLTLKGGRSEDVAKGYHEKFTKAWDKVLTDYDANQNAIADDDKQNAPSPSFYMFGGAKPYWSGGR